LDRYGFGANNEGREYRQVPRKDRDPAGTGLRNNFFEKLQKLFSIQKGFL